MAEALPDLAALSGLIVAFGLVFLADAVVRALFGTVTGLVGWIPYLGHVVEAPVEKIEQKLTNALGAAEAKIGAAIGASFHKLASALITLAELLIALPVLLYDVAKLLVQIAVGNRVTHAVARAATHAAGAAGVTAQHGIDRVRAAEQDLGHGIDAVRGRVETLDHAITGVLLPEVATLRERAHAAEQEASRAWDLIRKHEEALGIGAVTGAVAIALERLGGSWIRCRGVGRVGRGLCGLSGLIETILSDALEALIVTDLCEVVALMAAAAKEFEPVLLGFVDVENALIGCHGATLPPALKVPSLSLPPVTGLVAA